MVRERGWELEGHTEVESQKEKDRTLTERKLEKIDLGWRVNEVQQSLKADYSSLNELAPSPSLTTTSHSWLLVLSLQQQVPSLSSNSTCMKKVWYLTLLMGIQKKHWAMWRKCAEKLYVRALLKATFALGEEIYDHYWICAREDPGFLYMSSRPYQQTVLCLVIPQCAVLYDNPA